ncbi:PhoH-like ATPase [Carboxydocella sporoproducens DSM 16521]|uniref:PhoH-like ATPase n=2 Tax=Carboxydocella TaxID=178898 RepID=A0A1T4MFF6_9FIRM|nr:MULTISPECIES: PhoH family protein [Carboxydocella]AVX21311.1 PhoH-like ATPase [Carboxydocella thermautotrophica]AVX31742.1 PhoH-like ATPase [Carboxydocella thermautotrophica]GAW29355.1 phosphate starvation-inducible protein PhoH [Carboxydocella sp. ULO1]SJZ65682.1 PhoH-like ATPase [Carboxydocella sporoproducens DSM 16521]
MKKLFILDTNVLLHDPQSLFRFQEHEVVLPLLVIEELDEQKRRMDEVGRNARRVAKALDQLRQSGKLHEGIPTPGGGFLRVELAIDLPKIPEIKSHKADNSILALAKMYADKYPEREVTLVTKDIYLRIKADALGIKTEDYKTDRVNVEEMYSGTTTLKVAGDQIDRFYQEGQLVDFTGGELVANQFVTLLCEETGQSALGRFDHSKKAIVPLRYGNKDAFGIRARNKEQRFAMELLFDPNIKLVTLVGQAGTGKTLLAVAAGLEQVVETEDYKKLLVTRPIVPLGNDIGFLPGEKDEKLRPWMSPIYDNIEYILSGVKEGKKEKDSKPTSIETTLRYFKERGQLELEAITYIRGRSIPHQFVIVDEAQNLTPHEVKTILTRVGEGTKIVLTGDPFQVDHPYLDSNSNGLTFVAEKFKDQPIAGHVVFTKGERSELAELAATII